jgi:excisionase family DNA binding protein
MNIVTQEGAVQGIEPLLTVDEVSKALKKSRRYVIKLIHVGTLRGIRFSAHSWRVEPDEYRRFIRTAAERGGVDGYRHARTAGGARRKTFTIQSARIVKHESKSYPVSDEG